MPHHNRDKKSPQSSSNRKEHYPCASLKKLKAKNDVTDKTKNNDIDFFIFIFYYTIISSMLLLQEIFKTVSKWSWWKVVVTN